MRGQIESNMNQIESKYIKEWEKLNIKLLHLIIRFPVYTDI